MFAGLEAAAEWNPDAVVVATPPSEHLAGAAWALARGRPVLVEKPLAATVAEADELLELALDSGVHVAVGYNLRFHPGLQAVAEALAAGRVGQLLHARAEVGSLLSSWHPDADYRLGSAARAELGGGALLTLSHELDLVLWTCGAATLAAGVRSRLSALDINADDVAELVLRHESGALGSVHMDLADRAYNRRARWVGDEATIEWSWGGPALLRGDRDEVLWDDLGFDFGETYRAELEAFLAGHSAPGDPLRDARAVLALAEETTWL